jgi:hypothetical protein
MNIAPNGTINIDRADLGNIIASDLTPRHLKSVFEAARDYKIGFMYFPRNCQKCGFSLIEKLLIEGGEYALEALRIVYDLRHCLEVRERYSERLPEWFRVDDLAVQFIATRLANAWTINLEKPLKELPTFYELGMPDDPQAAKFEKPSGFGSTSTGLWTESPYDWTWTLDTPPRGSGCIVVARPDVFAALKKLVHPERRIFAWRRVNNFENGRKQVVRTFSNVMRITFRCFDRRFCLFFL